MQRFWQEIGEVFDPKRPVRDAALFAHRKREYDEMRRLEKHLGRPFDDQKYLVAGSVGNGKTSSLLYLSDNLAQRRMVVLFDLWTHFQGRVRDVNALDRLEPWELVGLLGLAVLRAGEEHFGLRWTDEPKALEAALRQLRTAEEGGSEAEIDVARLMRGLVVAAGGVAGAVAGGPITAAIGAGAAKASLDAGLHVLDVASDATTWKWRLGLGGQRRTDQDEEVRNLLHAVNAIIMRLQKENGQRLVLVVDGIDRVRDPERLDLLRTPPRRPATARFIHRTREARLTRVMGGEHLGRTHAPHSRAPPQREPDRDRPSHSPASARSVRLAREARLARSAREPPLSRPRAVRTLDPHPGALGRPRSVQCQARPRAVLLAPETRLIRNLDRQPRCRPRSLYALDTTCRGADDERPAQCHGSARPIDGSSSPW